MTVIIEYDLAERKNLVAQHMGESLTAAVTAFKGLYPAAQITHYRERMNPLPVSNKPIGIVRSY